MSAPVVWIGTSDYPSCVTSTLLRREAQANRFPVTASECSTMRLGYCCNLLLCVTLHLRYVAAGASQGVLFADGDGALKQAPIAFLSSWDVLGPFRLGTRGTARQMFWIYVSVVPF